MSTDVKVILNEQDKNDIVSFVDKVDIHNLEHLMNYGLRGQEELGKFSEKVLEVIKVKEFDLMSKETLDLITQLNGATKPAEHAGIFGFLKKKWKKVKTENTNIAKVIQNIEEQLKKNITNIKDSIMLLDKLEVNNKEFIKQLMMYVESGELIIKKNKHEENVHILESRLTDLKATLELQKSLHIQIKMLKSNNISISNKINTSIHSAIPMWKTQFLVNANLSVSREALQTQTKINTLTNNLILNNSDVLKNTLRETASEVEKQVIEAETVKKIQQDIITTLTDVKAVHNQARLNRANINAMLDKTGKDLEDKLIAFQKAPETIDINNKIEFNSELRHLVIG